MEDDYGVEQATAAPGEKRNVKSAYLTPIEEWTDEELIGLGREYLLSLRGTSGHIMAMQEAARRGE